MKAVFLDYGTVSAGDLDASRLSAILPGLELLDVTPPDKVGARLAGAEIVLTNKTPINATHMEGNRQLRLISLAATGTNAVDVETARRLNIGVCNIRGYCTPSVVQHVFAVILSLTHHLRRYQQLATDGTWGSSTQFTTLQEPIRELAGRTLGIVGMGELGRGVARIGGAFGMHVLVANRPGAAPQPGRMDLHEMLLRVDVLSLHCPLTPETRNLIGVRELALMKRDALLINTARGGLVEVNALADALRNRRIGGAALDVLPQEPPVDGSPLFAPDLPNLIVTPHTAWAARESRQRALDEMAANIEDFFRGGRRGRVV